MANQYIFRIQGPNEIASGVYYEVDLSVAPIGVGGMGQVFKGIRVEESTGVKKEVAVKFLQENLPHSVIERAEREASIRLHNDNLVEMIDFVKIDYVDPQGNKITRLHVVSELLRGVMLYDLLQGKTNDTYGEEVQYAKQLLELRHSDPCNFAVQICKKVLAGITALHDAGYIHRDIDPSNIMITVDNKIKLIDFGIARPFNNLSDERQLTIAGNFLGKAGYAAPELVLGDIAHQNETTDIYAIGILLFQLATGTLPFDGPAQDVLEMQRNKPMPLDKISDKKLRKIIGVSTEKSQQDRYQTASEFRVALDKYWNGNNSQQLRKNATEVTDPNQTLLTPEDAVGIPGSGTVMFEESPTESQNTLAVDVSSANMQPLEQSGSNTQFIGGSSASVLRQGTQTGEMSCDSKCPSDSLRSSSQTKNSFRIYMVVAVIMGLILGVALGFI